ncbi:pre-peptidase C-terminal domain-containing protein [Vibrio sp. PP-XX7]
MTCLLPIYAAVAQDVITLTNAEPQTELSGTTNSTQYFQIEVPDGATNLSFRTSGGTGDVDLYVKAGQQPTLNNYDCRPYLTGNNERCDSLTQTHITYYIMLHGYYDYSGVTLSASYTPQGDQDDGNSDSGTTTGACEMTAVQSELLAAHNAARSEGRNCGSTFYPAAPALTWNCKLATAAAVHNQDMVTNDYFDHIGSDGTEPWDRAEAAGYSYSYIGENIAAGCWYG